MAKKKAKIWKEELINVFGLNRQTQNNLLLDTWLICVILETTLL